MNTAIQRDKNQYVFSLIDLIPASIFWKDTQGCYQGCNQYMLTMTGLSSRDEVIGKFDDALPWKNAAMQLRQIDNDVMTKEVISELEESLILGNDQARQYMTIKRPMYDELGNVNGILGMSMDITDKKRADKLEAEQTLQAERIELLKSIAGSISHELRTPLAQIALHAQALKKLSSNNAPLSPDAINTLANKILSAVHVGNHLVTTQLNNVQKENFDTSRFRFFSLNTLVQTMLEHYPFAAQELPLINVNLETDFSIWTEEVLFNTLLWNLLKNALYYIKEQGKGKITIWSVIGDDTDDYNYLYVKDTAKGLSMDIAANVFDRFFSSRPHGTGVGLAYCKALMEASGGKIHCEGIAGEHATFILHFPKLD